MLYFVAASSAYLLFKKDVTKICWEGSKKQVKKNLLATYSNDNKSIDIYCELIVFPEMIQTTTKYVSKKIFKEEVIYMKTTDIYIFIYTKKHEAVYIPLYKILYQIEEISAFEKNFKKFIGNECS